MNDPENDQYEWEVSKENVLPLRQGRKTANLTVAALQPHSAQTADKLEVKQQRMKFENELRTYEGDDPLDVWHRYIKWTEQTYPKGGKDSFIQDILKQCVTEYKDDERYKNDPRYLTIWIKFANICSEPADIYTFLFNQKIGYNLASFYDVWASELERIDNVKKADAIYVQGIEIGAEPLDMLKKKHSEFQARVVRRVAGEVIDPPERVTEAEDPKRTVLGALKSKGPKARVSADRVGASIAGSQGLRIASQAPQQSSNKKGGGFRVFNDENAVPSALPTPTGDWSHIPDRDTNVENEQKPGQWNKGKLKQKHIPSVKISEISSVVKPEFSIHTDDDVPEPAATPRQINPQVSHVLSAKKQPKNADLFYQVQHTQEDPSVRPMYCKHKIYAGAIETSFEEIRASRWLEKKKRLEEQQYRKEMAERAELMRRQESEHLAAMREQEQRLEEQRLALRQEQDRLRQQQERMEEERLQMQERMANIAVQQTNRPVDNKLKGHLGNKSLTSNTSITPSSLMGSNLTPNISGITPTSFSQGPNLSVKNDSRITPQNPSTGSLSKPQFSFNSSTSASLNMSVNKGSAKNTPSFSGKLTAPSPTINTKQALSTVLGMFNSTMDVNQFGWGGPEAEPEGEEDMLGLQFANGAQSAPEPPQPKAPAPFQIYEEPAAPAPVVSLPIVDKENDVPKIPMSSSKPVTRGALGALSAPLEDPTPPTTSSASLTAPHTDVEMADDDLVVASKSKWDADNMDALENFPSELTFAPSYSSTCKFDFFSDAARLASTPFNPSAGMAPLQAPVSNIKPGAAPPQPDKTAPMENTDFTMDPFSGRSSMYDTTAGKKEPKELSPIIERSDEDVKSQYGDGPNNTVQSLIGRQGFSGSHTEDHSQHHHTTHDTIGHSSKLPHFPEVLNTIDEEAASKLAGDLANMTCGNIDTTNYVPPEHSDKMESMMNMSIAINPHDPFDEEAIEGFLSRLPKPLSSVKNYHSLAKMMPQFKPKTEVTLGKHTYEILKPVGSGAFANIFLVKRMDGTKNKHSIEVLKVQKPGWPWEFYICKTLQERMSKLNMQKDMRQGVMKINEGFFFADGSAMTNTLHEYGTLLDVVNALSGMRAPRQKLFCLLLAVDLCHLLEQLHNCHIIHGDFKPDNLLVTDLPTVQTDLQTHLAEHQPCIKLIDFGRSIDMTMYPDGTTFMAKVNTSGFLCIEMKTNKPWTYQTDLYGLVATLHVMLFGKYMTIRQNGTEWKANSTFRTIFLAAMWQDIFKGLLNIPSCYEIPDLAGYRHILEKEIQKIPQKDVQDHNKSMETLRQHLLKQR